MNIMSVNRLVSDLRGMADGQLAITEPLAPPQLRRERWNAAGGLPPSPRISEGEGRQRSGSWADSTASLIFEDNVAVEDHVSLEFSLRLWFWGWKVTYKAWMTPGNQPRMVKQMLMRKSAPHPRSRKTPRGGRIMAKIILQMSLWSKLAMFLSSSHDELREQVGTRMRHECENPRGLSRSALGFKG